MAGCNPRLQAWPSGALSHDHNEMDCFTADLPLQIRVAMARQWMTAVALEMGLKNQPDEELHEALHLVDFITEDMADVGLDALTTLDSDLGHLLLTEVSNQCQVCPNCLMETLFGEEE